MSEPKTHHRLEGLEPGNLLAFLALLGVMRSLEAANRTQTRDSRLEPRAFWDTTSAPLRPVLRVGRPVSHEDIADIAIRGIEVLRCAHEFAGRKDLNYDRTEARNLLEGAAKAASAVGRDKADVLAALMSDAAIKDSRDRGAAPVDATPFCLLYGQGHQHFLERMSAVPAEPTPPKRGSGRAATTISASECIQEALFGIWHRSDPTFSFRWDPHEDIRYALMAGDPTDSAYKGGTQHGANRLAAVGLAVLTVVPETRSGRVRSTVVGGSFDSGGFSFRWPIWKDPASLSAIKSLLTHTGLSTPGALAHLGVEFVMTTRRISVGKFMNFTHAKPEIGGVEL